MSESLRSITALVMLFTGILGVLVTILGSEKMLILTLVSSLVAFGFFLFFLFVASPER